MTADHLIVAGRRTDRGSPEMSLEGLSRVLWRERELLELLLFKLEEEQLVLASGRSRWLAHATREVETVLEQIREAEVLRAMEVEAAAAALGLPPGPSLTALADAASAPWDDLLRSHREAFMSITNEIGATADANRQLLVAGARSSRETLLGLGATTDVETYAPGAGKTAEATRASAHHARLLDEAL